ncbi:hypothetical protein [Streptomyces sp. WAC06614]|uniref:hypothetical protein n=1 Tax=Streptomyces sp. WAC06614 TaxID=2487416 RepID=UPI000F7AF400|nr:hypothetical protein [Streptomyces sp. WAC06614]RSS80053.1 hypothetical protein EF918_15100 [Streptomyces sp. WAC06614]
MNRSTSMTMTAATVVTGLTLLVAACTGTGTGSSDGTKSDGTKNDASQQNAGASGKGGGAGGNGTTGQDADKALKVRKCLREHGIDAPDPQPGQDPRGMTLGGGSEDPEALKKAFEACGMQAPGTGEMPQEQKDQALKWAKCMREHGVNVPDPEFKGNAMSGIQIPQGQEQAFEEAQKKCQAA